MYKRQEDSYSPYIESDQDQGHGSAVASIIVYGDELHDQEIVNKKGVKLYEMCIRDRCHIKLKYRML